MRTISKCINHKIVSFSFFENNELMEIFYIIDEKQRTCTVKRFITPNCEGVSTNWCVV